MMFGFVTKAKHEAALAYLQLRFDRSQEINAQLIAELDHLRPLANKWTAHVAQASKNLKQNKGKGK